MKLSSILCGVAVVAMMATSAEASGRGHGGGNPGHGNPPTTPSTTWLGENDKWGEYAQTTPQLSHISSFDWAEAGKGNANRSRWAAKKSMKGNTGTATLSDGADFSLKGNVSAHCVFYTGSSDDRGFKLGVIGIYASENHGPALVFNQVAGSSFEFRTNVSGCNTKNKVSLSRTQAGLVTNPSFGYNGDQFTTEIPYSVKATYTASSTSKNNTSTVAGVVELANNEVGTKSKTHGAWKSPMEIVVNLGVASKALVAGEYTGSFSVLIEAI